MYPCTFQRLWGPLYKNDGDRAQNYHTCTLLITRLSTTSHQALNTRHNPGICQSFISLSPIQLQANYEHNVKLINNQVKSSNPTCLFKFKPSVALINKLWIHPWRSTKTAFYTELQGNGMHYTLADLVIHGITWVWLWGPRRFVVKGGRSGSQ